MSPDPIHFLAGTLVCRLDTRRLNRSRCDEFIWGLRQIIREMATELEVQADPALITMDFVKEVYARCNPDMHMGAQALKDALADLIRRMVTEQTDEFLLRHRHVA